MFIIRRQVDGRTDCIQYYDDSATKLLGWYKLFLGEMWWRRQRWYSYGAPDLISDNVFDSTN